MPGTTLQDIIVPSLFNPYVINRTMELSALYNSGIISNNTEFDALASQAAPVVNMPFFEDLSGDAEPIIEGVEAIPDKITSSMDKAVIVRRYKAWSATDLSAALSGADPMAAIGSLVAGFWARQLQRELIAMLTGIFGTIPATTDPVVAAETRNAANLHDISSNSGTAAKWSASAFIDAQQLLGDAKAQLTAVAMHSATEAELRKQNLIDTVVPSNAEPFNTYMGKRIIVDDGCPVSGTGTSAVFSTYLFGEGAIAFGNGSPVNFKPTEVDRKKMMGSGVDQMINRKTFILHPRGNAYQQAVQEKAEGPTREELANPKNWKPVYDAKHIRIVEFRHKLG